MKLIRIASSLLLLALLLPVACLAQGSAQTDDISKLREQIAAQQKQLDEQRQALESAQKSLEAAQKAIDSQQKTAGPSGCRAGCAGSRSSASRGAASRFRGRSRQQRASLLAAGVSHWRRGFHAPGGFMDMSTVWRSAITSEAAWPLPSPSVPFSNTAAGGMDGVPVERGRTRVWRSDHHGKSD
jgi:uncharacterized coiled-coil protein SlyX